MRVFAARLISGMIAAVGATAQIPTRATALDPTLPSYVLGAGAQSGDSIHVLGADQSFAYAGLYYARSRDGGRTWPLREIPVIQGATLVYGLAADSDTVVALIYAAGGFQEIHSADGGTTWSSPSQIPATAVHVQGTTVIMAKPQPMTILRSIDGGATWQPPQVIDSSTHGEDSARLVGDGLRVHAFWRDLGVWPWALMHSASSDGGVTWSLPQNLGSDGAGGIVASGNLLVVGTAPAIQRSIDGGATWSAVVLPGMGYPRIGGSSDRVIAAEDVATPLGQYQYLYTVLVNTSVDGGLTWRPAPVQMFPPTQVTSLYAPLQNLRPSCAGDAWYVDIHDAVMGGVRLSLDGGTTWGLLNGVSEVWTSPARVLALAGTYPPPHTFIYLLAGHAPVGRGTAGSGSIEPHLAGSAIPGPGMGFSLDVTNALGGSPGVLALAFGAPTPTSLYSATLFVPSPLAIRGFSTSGSSTQPGVGSVSIHYVVPNSMVFSGLALILQAFVLDPGAVDGFAATGALESWFQ